VVATRPNLHRQKGQPVKRVSAGPRAGEPSGADAGVHRSSADQGLYFVSESTMHSFRAGLLSFSTAYYVPLIITTCPSGIT
jgi:hypothetical protein